MRDFIWGNKGGIRLELDTCGIPLFCRKISLRVEADTFTSHKVRHSTASLKLSNTNDLKQRIFFVKHLFGIPILFTKYGLCLPNESSAQTETWWWQLQDGHICEYDQNHWKMKTWRMVVMMMRRRIILLWWLRCCLHRRRTNGARCDGVWQRNTTNYIAHILNIVNILTKMIFSH